MDKSSDAGTPPVPRFVIIRGITKKVTKEHLDEIFKEYGHVLSIGFSSDSTRMIDSYAPLGESLGYVEMETPEAAQKAMDYMDGGLLDKVKVEVTVSTKGRPRTRKEGRQHGRSGKGSKRSGKGARERRLAREGVRRTDSRRRSPSRQGHGNRYARSPSPYRGGRRARDRRSPVRSRSPYGGRRYGGGGGGPRYQNRSPSPRHGGGYRGGRYARSRSFSRSRR
ncbi:RNA-binding protein with serine-rich domain 1 [Coemansia sp. RSA 2424]|nr:RNA-binding protein with serine-rich domain 1 [Coemansia sp. RSA 2424]